LCEDRAAQKDRECNTNGADQVKTVARHDSLPRFAGAPLIFYNCIRSVARHKVVIVDKRQSLVRDAFQVGRKRGFAGPHSLWITAM
jgi:hypothetical protein